MKINLAESTDLGDLGVLHLKRLWSRSMRERFGLSEGASFPNEWGLDNVIFHGLNLPIEETIQFLYQAAPGFADFENWVLSRNNGSVPESSKERINTAVVSLLNGENAKLQPESPVTKLSDADAAFWDANGYIVVSGVFSDAEVEAAANGVWEHLGMDPDDSDSWYSRPRDHGIMVQLFDHPALERIRRSERLKSVFAQIWNTSDLWISTDRTSFNPPERPGHEFPGPYLHWDVSLEPPIPFGVQGLVYLTDTEADHGAFTCVPGFHTRIETWLKDLPGGVDPRDLGRKLDSIAIPGKAGDVVIWHQALPHGSRPNRLDRPRIVQYVTMFPSDASYAERWR